MSTEISNLLSTLRAKHPLSRFALLPLFSALALTLSCTHASAQSPEDTPDFSFDVRPILADKCYGCHGPDKQSAKLRLDLPDVATASGAIIPGDPTASELIARITTADDDDRMPPPDVSEPLAPDEIDTLSRWIRDGAQYKQHWAFAPPLRLPLPQVENKNQTNNPIDHFVLSKLEREGLSPSEKADALTLLRRVKLDLLGLPPTLEEIDQYLEDQHPDRYQHMVDRFLASPHYGERWARHWLDGAQYADSDGYEKDKPREVWAWRDWVIDALNDDIPYDEFIIKQVAGDLLPNATQEDRIATGFLRNTLNNEEGGIDPEQFRMAAMFNRMDIIGRSVLGLTVQCAQCHTHKFDPLTQTEYYEMMAFINNTHEAAIPVYKDEAAQRRDTILKRITTIEENLRQETPRWKKELTKWEKYIKSIPDPTWQVLPLEFDDSSADGQKFIPQPDGSYLAQSFSPVRTSQKVLLHELPPEITAIRLELLRHGDLPRGGPGRSIVGGSALSEFELRVAPPEALIQDYGQWTPIEFASAISDINPSRRPLSAQFPPEGDEDRHRVVGPIELAVDGKIDTAWTTYIDPARGNQSGHAIFKLASPLALKPGMQLAIRLRQEHGGTNNNDNQANNLGRFRVSVTNAVELPGQALPHQIKATLAIPKRQRTDEQRRTLFRFWAESRPQFSDDIEWLNEIWADHPEGTSQLAFVERDVPRQTHRLERGDFLSPAETVSPNVPDFLHPFPEDAPRSRLGFARWLAAENSPTTARTIVNRIWQRYFGTGLVNTPGDLGLQGASPTHPKLLDWLAIDFMDSGWHLKHLHRRILMSATYRQSSRLTPDLQVRDPENRLLARGPRVRLEGEIIRDVALAASGLLSDQIGGPSVFPPAPKFLFEPPLSYGDKPWYTDSGSNRYRRGLYTFRYRSAPYPMFETFDGPSTDQPCVRRDRSNTPLQALTTLNEPLFQESARALAATILRHGGESDEDRIKFAFRRCVTRPPSETESRTMTQFIQKKRARIESGDINPEMLLEATEAVPEWASNKDAEELAAWTLTARVLLNLDETVTKQ